MGELYRSSHLSLSPQQLQEGSLYLGQVFLGLAALTQMNSENLATMMATLQAEPPLETSAPSLGNAQVGINGGKNINNLNSSGVDLNFLQLSDRLLSPSGSNPQWQPLTSPELDFSIRVLVHLCQQNQELIRRAVSLMEQMMQEGKDPWQVTLLKNYGQRLTTSAALHRSSHLSEDASHQWQGKILFDLLFYSSPYGQQRLWLRCTQPVNIGKT